ncbi:hypothetical protein [Litorisediminicola beolgyonensis]|uniref:MAPEG family protein n=1 Tax=Litorisediminicola beolgyonensis TaxID=1173614 RepID=A0ABW3ZCV3_9RHOB
MSFLSDLHFPKLPAIDGISASREADYTPVLAGLLMVGAGLLLRRTAPGALRLPEPGTYRKIRDVRSGRDAAHVARDGIARLIPNNLTGSLGRTLVLMGTATIAVRLLDAFVDDDSALY